MIDAMAKLATGLIIGVLIALLCGPLLWILWNSLLEFGSIQ